MASRPPLAPRQAKIAKGGLAAGTAAALVLAVTSLRTDEGKRNVDYLDIARVPTACFGHTGPDVQVGRRRTDAECVALLTADAQTHMDGVLRCSPELAGRPTQLAAATRLAFNVGVANWCRSRAAAQFRAGRWRAGCDAFLLWSNARVNGRMVQVRGLLERRKRERTQCLQESQP